ncbi:C2 domain-containing protein/PI-PLC-Y domain-containing protein/PI-PLC-X domain-containing protein/efhand_like domain-containing protein [Cephalotus follicularis]|uniref:Phosphoinositide phospholipase C n=1 Tax=Cephalotus follicularis TaxID=3775 RepID=A0A1Q3BF36_CEPFO|nr:C2 domain-containing protein/PI-PLC-Y domain-containing protein/PI-PLC-X domain-containing protein/efhand_like domain-containing protein [Cephalotus follicularis]
MSEQSFSDCFCFRKILRLHIVEPPEEIRNQFIKYSTNGFMSIDDLQRFLTDFQEESNAISSAKVIFDSLKRLKIFQRSGLLLEAFFKYLLSDLNPPLYPKVHHDMNAPLAHYFLYTGHNSYLTGNQLWSKSSVEPIIKALKRGVRVIELDLWPNSRKDNAEVRHGGTLTAPVDLLKCLRAIKDYAFVATEYPVVITFEDHLTPNLQRKVAKMVNKTFGGMLFTLDPESDYLTQFPSPEFLRKKVLISTKPPKKYLESQSLKEKEKAQKSENSAAKVVVQNEEKDDLLDDEQFKQDGDEDTAVPEYKRLISIRAGKLKGGSGNLLNVDLDEFRRVSLSEVALEDAAKTCGTDIVRFTQRNLMRVYPKGTRITSSNYNPFVGWMHGAQMVAFNMQGYGKYLAIMQGMFRANGGCGYVKKPEFLLHVGPNNEVFDPKAKLPVKILLKVKVYLGEGWHSDFRLTHFDRCSPPDFYAKIGIAGVPTDKVKKRTKTLEDEWLPVWDEEFEFPLTVPELAILRIKVLEEDATGRPEFAGQTCLPVLELRTGIRAVPLYDKKGQKYRSVRLLMRFQMVQYQGGLVDSN